LPLGGQLGAPSNVELSVWGGWCRLTEEEIGAIMEAGNRVKTTERQVQQVWALAVPTHPSFRNCGCGACLQPRPWWFVCLLFSSCLWV
jgi:hypothetical protein